MTDIVERLRGLARGVEPDAYHVIADIPVVAKQAADEIERLRAEVVALQSSLEVGAKEKK